MLKCDHCEKEAYPSVLLAKKDEPNVKIRVTSCHDHWVLHWGEVPKILIDSGVKPPC